MIEIIVSVQLPSKEVETKFHLLGVLNSKVGVRYRKMKTIQIYIFVQTEAVVLDLYEHIYVGHLQYLIMEGFIKTP